MKLNGKKRQYHIFLSADTNEIQVLAPKEKKLKDKWRMPIEKIEKVWKGFNKGDGTPFLKKRGFSWKGTSTLLSLLPSRLC